MKIMLDDYAITPTRAHDTDAGLDLYVPTEGCHVTEENGVFMIDTGVHVQLPKGTVGFVKGRSSLNKSGIICLEGTIDEGYTGSIRIGLMPMNKKAKRLIVKGAKVAQLVICSIKTPKSEFVDKLEETERGDGGFGSTGA